MTSYVAIPRQPVGEPLPDCGDVFVGQFRLLVDDVEGRDDGVYLCAPGAADWERTTLYGAELTTLILETTPPPGSIMLWAASAPPSGWLLCDGASLLRADYPDLFAVIGTTYGAADATHFSLPNLKSRFPLGLDAANAANDTLGETGGARDVTLTAAQSGLPAHEHTEDKRSFNTVENTMTGGTAPRLNDVSSNIVSTGGGVAQDASQSHTNMPPFLTLHFIIRT